MTAGRWYAGGQVAANDLPKNRAEDRLTVEPFPALS